MNLTRHQLASQAAQILQNLYPTPSTELFYTNPFTFLIAVILSAQSQDAQVNKVTPPLFQVINTPDDLIAMGKERLQNALKTLGLYKNKASYIINLSQQLIEKFEGRVPNERHALESLPGVGRKTANVFLNHIHHLPTIPVDTHVLRVSHRLGLSGQETPWGVEQDLEDLFPINDHYFLGIRLVLFGRHHCKARQPLCTNCPLNTVCPYLKAK